METSSGGGGGLNSGTAGGGTVESEAPVRVSGEPEAPGDAPPGPLPAPSAVAAALAPASSSVAHQPRQPAAAPAVPKKMSSSDFDYGTVLGAGAFGNVFHVRLHGSLHEYAMKVMQKAHIKKENKIHFVKMEREVLTKAAHANIIKLAYSFQDEANLYIVTELCRGGELLRVIRTFNAASKHPAALDAGGTTGGSDSDSDDDDDAARLRRRLVASASAAAMSGLPLNSWGSGVPLPLARFYAAQLVSVLEYLHTSLHVVHRDIKPENILLSESGHIKLADFGSAKDENAQFGDSRQDAFVGTAEYVSPELLRDETAHAPADLWALGCVLYQLCVGVPPFHGGSEYLTFQQILGWDAALNDPATAPGSSGHAAAVAAAVAAAGSGAAPATIPAEASSHPLTPETYTGIGVIVIDELRPRGSAVGASSAASIDHENLATIPEDSDVSESGVPVSPQEKSPSQHQTLRRSSSSSKVLAAAGGTDARRMSRADSLSAALATRPPPSVLRFPAGFPLDARHLILSLLRPQPSARLGVTGATGEGSLACGPVRLRYSDIKGHAFFQSVDWAHVCDPKYTAPYVPPASLLRAPRPALEVHAAAAAGGLGSLASLDADDSSALHVLPHVKAAVIAAQRQAASSRQLAASVPPPAPQSTTAPAPQPGPGPAAGGGGSTTVAVPPPLQPTPAPPFVAVGSKRTLFSSMFSPLFGSATPPSPSSGAGDAAADTRLNGSAPSSSAPVCKAASADGPAGILARAPSVRGAATDVAAVAATPSKLQHGVSVMPMPFPARSGSPALPPPSQDDDFRPSAVTSASAPRKPPASPLPDVRFVPEGEEQPGARRTPAAGPGTDVAAAPSASFPAATELIARESPLSAANAAPGPDKPAARSLLTSFVRDGYIQQPEPGDAGLLPVRMLTLPMIVSAGQLPPAGGGTGASPLMQAADVPPFAALTAAAVKAPSPQLSSARATVASGSGSPAIAPAADGTPPGGTLSGSVAAAAAASISPALLTSPPPQPWWVTHVDPGETVVRAGPVEKRKAGYLQLFGPLGRELALCCGGQAGPRLLYWSPHRKEPPLSISLADPELRVLLRSDAAAPPVASTRGLSVTGLSSRALADGSGSQSARKGEGAALEGQALPPTPLARFAHWLGIGSSHVGGGSVGAPPSLTLGDAAVAASREPHQHAAASSASAANAAASEPLNIVARRSTITRDTHGSFDASVALAGSFVVGDGGMSGSSAATCTRGSQVTEGSHAAGAASATCKEGAVVHPAAVTAATGPPEALQVSGPEAATPPAAAAALPGTPPSRGPPPPAAPKDADDDDADAAGGDEARPLPLQFKAAAHAAATQRAPSSVTPGGTGSGTLLVAHSAAAMASSEDDTAYSPTVVVARQQRVLSAASAGGPQQARGTRHESLRHDVETLSMSVFGGDARGSRASSDAAAAAASAAASAGSLSGAPNRSAPRALLPLPPPPPAGGASSSGGGGLGVLGMSARGQKDRDRGVFDIHTGVRSALGGRTFFLLDPQGNAAEWKAAIQGAVDAHAASLAARVGSGGEARPGA